jgi:hypothetical protein
MIQAERVLHNEVIWQLRAARPDCVVVPVPNGTWIPARTQSERALVARLIARMKAEGQIMPGVRFGRALAGWFWSNRAKKPG